FTRAPSPAHPDNEGADPNTLIDPMVLALPGALPVPNALAVELSARVGLALGCQIARRTKWDRKSYYYADLPKNYQISQYDMPLCFDGAIDLPATEDTPATRIGIIRAHLEEDAGKLLHDWPGGTPIDFSIVDLNRAGTPLLEIVTAPDFTSAEQAVTFAQMLRTICRFLGATEGDMQKGHMRFEPNINTVLTLDDGRIIKTPIVEIKNLNSFRALRGAIEYELREQPKRWNEDAREMASGTKSTRGWDDTREISFLQREKEEAHDYRYFPDPDLLPVEIAAETIEQWRSELPELPHQRAARYRADFTLGEKEARALTEERDTCLFFEAATDAITDRGIDHGSAGKLAANSILQVGFRLAKERGLGVEQLGITIEQLADIMLLRSEGRISATGAETLFEQLCASEQNAEDAAAEHNLLLVTDSGALEQWCDEVIADEKNAKAIEDVRGGKDAAIGRLIGAVMQRSGGSADAKTVRSMLIERIRGG
ncbi:MAG: Asp-tRNA(Asn)/Glu-tRNA(Gln) amidotransferase subunit GatB, partial [Planctomycetota bacterium]